MSDYLFAYGTLHPVCAPEEIAHVVATFKPVGEGFVRGQLFDLGEYPGVLLDSSAHGLIFGTVFQLPEGRTDALHLIDLYEGYNLNEPEESLFIRRLHTITLESGTSIECWVYIYNGVPDPSRIIASGRYRRH